MFSSQTPACHGRDEVDGVRVRHVDDVLVGADAVERRASRSWAASWLRDLQAPAGVREADDRALRLRPLQIGRSQVGQSSIRFVPGIVLLLQPEQHEVAGVARRETRRPPRRSASALIGRRERMVLRREELLLVVLARPPGQHAADVELLAQDLRHHVLGQHAFGRVLVVRAAGGVDVVIAGEPAVARRDRSSARAGTSHSSGPGERDASGLRPGTRARA